MAAETGLHYNRFRDYDPVTGRYVESDPIGLNGGVNAYAYAAGNPIAHIDPLGLFFTSVDAACAQDPLFCAEIIGDMRETPRSLAQRHGICMPEDEGWFASPEARVAVGVAAAVTATVAGVLQLRRGKVPDNAAVVRGGVSDVPPPGQVFSGAAGETLEDAAKGVPHGQIRATTAGEIRAAGGTVDHAPELTRSGVMNDRHVNICLGNGPCPFGPLQTNPVPKADRIK